MDPPILTYVKMASCTFAVATAAMTLFVATKPGKTAALFIRGRNPGS
jgi:hypothetical protein